jgi:tetratricopeptide (TPR) repeat protein
VSSRDDPTRADVTPTRRLEAERGPSTIRDTELDVEAGTRVGQRIGHFEIRDVLGTGGMGTVFEARDLTLDRAVALKLLHPDLAARSERRVLREAQALAKLSHPNVVQVFEAGIAEGRPFIAMELVRGQTLAHWQASPHGWRECVSAYLQAGRGLAAAHERGLVHRDFKPSNCILDEDGRVRVLDFGLAQRIESSLMNEVRSHVSFEELPLTGGHGGPPTRAHGATGTLGYMPLEQLWGQALDAKSDQFSFCVSLFEALHRRRPFGGESMDALVMAMLEGVIDWPPGAAQAPARLRKLLERGLRAKPSGRWPAMGDVLRELELLLRRGNRRRRRWWYVGSGLAIAAVGAWWTMREPTCLDSHLELDDAWGPEQRARVVAAIEGSSVPVPTEVRPRLDAYAARWIALRGAACTAERDELVDADTARLRRQCLAEARDALGDVAARLRDGDDRMLAAAASWSEGLPDLSRCEDVTRFVTLRPLPDDPETAERVRALRHLHALVQVENVQGNGERALELLEEGIAEAEALGYAPLVAELVLVRGNLAVERGSYDAAEHDLERAYALAMEHDHLHVALDAAISLTYVVGDLRERHDVGFKWGLTADALARQPWSDPRRLASVMETMGNVLYEQGRLASALEHYEQALEIRDRIEPDGAAQPYTLANIGLVLHEQGRYEEALPVLHEVLARRQAELDPQHVAVAVSLISLATTLRRLGRHTEALAHLQQALEIRELRLGPDSPGVVIVLNELGRAWLDVGELPQALDAHQRALAYGTKMLGPSHSHVAEAWLGLGTVLQAYGMLDAAARHVGRAVRTYELAVGSRHPRFGSALCALGEIEHARGERVAAREHLELAVEILAQAEVPPAELAAARFALARMLWTFPAEQQAGLALAKHALMAYGTLGAAGRDRAAEIEVWLVEHAAR